MGAAARTARLRSTPPTPSASAALSPTSPTPRLLPSTPYLDTEVRIRTLAPQVGQLYLWYLFALIVPGTIAYALLGTPEAVGLVVQLAVIVPTAIFASIHSCALGSQLDLRKFFTPTLLAGLLLLPFAIGLNYAYHYIIYVYFDAPDVLGEMLENIPIEVRILMICILPAIVEGDWVPGPDPALAAACDRPLEGHPDDIRPILPSSTSAC